MKTSRSCALLTACLILPVHAFEPDVVIDANDNPANVELSPAASWTNESTVGNAFRGASKVRNTSISTDFARFHTTLPTEGPWQVFIWNNLGTLGSGSATVTHADGTANVTYNQYTNQSQWTLLGTFWFNTSAEAQVKIIGSASKLSADAVRFSLATPDITLDSGAAVGVTLSPSGDWASVLSNAGNQQNIRRSNTDGATLTFQPTLPAAGDYEISLWLPPNTGTWLPAGGTAATSFTVDVHGRNGVVTNHAVSMPGTAANEGRWVQIATSAFRFHATPPAGQPNPYPARIVVKTNGATGEWVPADAVRFTKVGVHELYMDEDDGTPVVTPTPAPWGAGTALSAQTWSNYGAPPFGSTYRAEYFNGSSTSLRSMTYQPDLTELGLYDVYLWYGLYNHQTPYNNPSTDLKIGSATGELSRTINQQGGSGKWTHVGRYIFYSGDDPDTAKRPWLKISTPTNPYPPGNPNYSYWFYYHEGRVLADGVLFVRDGEEADADGDALPDWHEILLGTNTSPADLNGDGVPDGWDTDGDTWSDGEEVALGLNPNSNDSDGDGKSDVSDQFPMDPLRNAPIPFTTYARLNLSAYDNQTMEAVHIANDDVENASFAGMAGDPQAFRAVAWKPGGVTTTTIQPMVATYTGKEFYLSPSGVTPLGTAFGIATANDGHYTFTRLQSSATPQLNSAGVVYGLEVLSNSDLGPMHGSVYKWFDTPPPAEFRNKTFTGSLSMIQTGYDAITLKATSLAGMFVGVEESANHTWLWNGALSPLPGFNAGVTGINDELDITGGFDSSAFYYSNGIYTPFLQLIPTEFRQQLAAIRPTNISNRETASGFPIIEFEAQSLEGPSPGEWIFRTLHLSKNAAGETLLVAAVAADGQADVGPSKRINNKGTGIRTALNGTQTVAELNPTFEWRERFGDIHLGFDPPMNGDANIGATDGTVPGVGSDLYKVNHIYRASVATGGNAATNEALQVWFRSKEFGEKTKLVVPAASAALIDVEPKDQALVLHEDARGGFASFFKIINKWVPPVGTYDDKTAFIELRTADTKNQLLGRLEVLIFPEVQVDLAIHRVHDPVGVAANPPRTALPGSLPTDAVLIQRLNKAFQQAGITFVLNTGASGAKPIRYDLNDDGHLEGADVSDSEFKVLNDATELSSGAKLNLVIVRGKVIKNSWYDGKQKVGGWAPTNRTTGRLIGKMIFQTTFDLEQGGDAGEDWRGLTAGCAHELGHALTLARRDGYDPRVGKLSGNRFHDLGMFPGQAFLRYQEADGSRRQFGLMYPRANASQYWMRHEDWRAGNEEAWNTFRK